MPENSFIDHDEEYSVSEYRLGLAIPYELKNKDLLGVKIQYKNFSIRSTVDSVKGINLHSFRLPFFYFKKYKNPKWSSYIEVCPKINSDFKNISRKHLQVGGTALFFYEKNQFFFWQLGIYYNQEAYGPFVMPLLGFEYKPGGNLYFSMLIPAFVMLEYKLSSRFYSGFEAELIGETYRLGNSGFVNSFISQCGENKLSFLMEASLFLDIYLTKHMVLYLKPGYRFLQKYEHFTEGDQKIINSDVLQGQLKNSFIFEFGLSYRFRYDEEQ